jgi:hypothetical protein
MTVRHIFEISEDDHPPNTQKHRWSPTPAIIDELQTSLMLSFSRVNSRAELVPSPQAYAQNGAQRRWLGDYNTFSVLFKLAIFCAARFQ